MNAVHHRDVHFSSADRAEPPCGTLEERFDWSDAVEDVTCEVCREILARASSDSGSADERPTA